jgi:hypothetical protein
LLRAGLNENLSEKLAAAWSENAKSFLAKRRRVSLAIEGRFFCVQICNCEIALFSKPGSKSVFLSDNVGDPDPHPNVFPSSGSVSISQRYGSRSRYFPFLIKRVERTEIILAK